MSRIPDEPAYFDAVVETTDRTESEFLDAGTWTEAELLELLGPERYDAHKHLEPRERRLELERQAIIEETRRVMVILHSCEA